MILRISLYHLNRTNVRKSYLIPVQINPNKTISLILIIFFYYPKSNICQGLADKDMYNKNDLYTRAFCW